MGDVITGKKDDIIMFLQGLNIDKDIVWDLKVHKNKRSLSQNALYWHYVGEMAKATGVSGSRIYNLHLRDLRILERLDGRPVTSFIPDTDEAENTVLESATYHLMPTDAIRVGDDGVTYRGYVMLKGSSDFLVDEMSALLNLAIQDAKQLGISTVNPDELEHIRMLEKSNEQRKTDKSV